MVHSPVLFITFARPDYARQAFDSIKKARPAKLYFYSNKGRADRPGEIERNDRIRAFIGEIDWDCELKTFFREEHVDIYTSLWGAIDWIFSNEEDAIILEEDCVASPAFFSFCDNLLSRYRDEPKVWIISGDNFTPRGNPDRLSYFFSSFAHIYGWAGWADRWRKLDRKMATWPETKNSKAFKSYFNSYFIVKYTRIRFDFIYKRLGAFNPWDYIFSFNMMKNHGYAVVPAVNLVSDIGSQGEHHPGYLKTGRATGGTRDLPEEFEISAEPQQIETTRYDRYHLRHHIIWPLIKRKSLRLIFSLVKRGG